ncbi:peptide ABC transporter substrate-binding protein [Streptomyces sp. NPDC002490]|uniref:ABC transporter substrate-binding protein n=1 Tax=Streptomyces sp. NPDC002490 TaxID=3154416 RepID=UPI00331E80FB
MEPDPPGGGPPPTVRRARRGRRGRPARGAALAASLALVAAASVGPATATAVDDGAPRTLKVAVSQSVDSLNPFLATRLISTSVHRLMYEYLTGYDPVDGRAVPGLATAWRASADKLTWTYTIRSDARWSDGVPVTAEDVAWTFRTMMTDEAAGAANGSFVDNFRAVSAPEPTRLVIRLHRPQATMTALDVPIVPRHVWAKAPEVTDVTNTERFPVVGSGPFVLVDHRPDSYVRLRANPTFWRGAPRFDELLLTYYKDGDAAVAALRKGEVSFVQGLTPAQAGALAHEPGVTLNDAPGRRFYALATNPGARTRDGQRFGDGHPSLLDARVRRALFMAVDRELLVERVFQGHAVVGQGYLPPRFAAYHWRPSADQRVPYDPAGAARLLDGAGYRRDGQGRRLGADGEPIVYRLLCHATDPNDKAIGRYLQEWYAELGIGVEVQCLDNVTDPWTAGEYDLAFDGWSVNPDPDFVLSLHTCGALPASLGVPGATDNFVCDRRYDALYARQLAEYDPERRAELVRLMQERLYGTGYLNVLAYPNAVEAYRSDRIGSITTMPAAAGNIYGQDGYWSWWSAAPARPYRPDAGAAPGGVLAGLAAAGAVLAGGAGAVALRRRATADDRE